MPRYLLSADDIVLDEFMLQNAEQFIKGLNSYGKTALSASVGGTGNPGSFSDRLPLVYDAASKRIVSATAAKGMFNNRFIDTDLLASDYAFYAVDTGSGNDYAIAFNEPITAYKAGQRFLVKATHENSGPTTLDVDGLGAKSLKNADQSNIKPGQIVSGQIFEAVYNEGDDLFQTWVPAKKTNIYVVTEVQLFGLESDTGGWNPNNTVDIGAAASSAGFSLEYQAVTFRVVYDAQGGDPGVQLTIRPDSGGPETMIAQFKQELGYDQSIVNYPVPDNGILEYRIDGNAKVSLHVVGFIT